MRPLAFALVLLVAHACHAAPPLLLYGDLGAPPLPPDSGAWAEVSIENSGLTGNAGVTITQQSITALGAHWFQSTATNSTQIGFGWLTAHHLGAYLSASTPLVLEPTATTRPGPTGRSEQLWKYNGAEVWADVLVIPEPATAMLLLAGVVGLRRRR